MNIITKSSTSFFSLLINILSNSKIQARRNIVFFVIAMATHPAFTLLLKWNSICHAICLTTYLVFCHFLQNASNSWLGLTVVYYLVSCFHNIDTICRYIHIGELRVHFSISKPRYLLIKYFPNNEILEWRALTY